MVLYPTRSGSSDDLIRQLQQRVQRLEQQLAALQKCIQVDRLGQNLTLKVGADLTIEAGASMDIKSGAVMKLVGPMIDLN